MKRIAAIALAALLAPAAAPRAEAPTAEGLAGTIRGCETWVVQAGSRVTEAASVHVAAGLGDKMGVVGELPPFAIPARARNGQNIYWRVNATPSAGYFVVTPIGMPMCHITGGGDEDFQPIVEALLASQGFRAHCEQTSEQTATGAKTTIFRLRSKPSFQMLVSRAELSGQRRDRVQLQITAGHFAN